jgi:hypothetical protein
MLNIICIIYKLETMKCPYATIECDYLDTAAMTRDIECEKCTHYDVNRIRLTGATPTISKTTKVAISTAVLLALSISIFGVATEESLVWVVILSILFLIDACWLIDLIVKKDM